MHLLSNDVNFDNVTSYDINPYDVALYIFKSSNLEIFKNIKNSKNKCELVVERRSQKNILEKLYNQLKVITESKWLNNRGINNYYDISHTDFLDLTQQEMLDLYVIPHDYLIKKFGLRKVEGLVFPDIQNGKFYGICIRNTSDDLEWVAHTKFTMSNFGFFVYGIDDIDDNNETYLCEGVFDVLAYRSIGKQAICFASAYPTTYQMARINRIKNLVISMDNDFYGWCGAYLLSKVMNIKKIVLSKYKDPCETIIDNKCNEFQNVSCYEIEKLIINNIDDHNRKIDELNNKNLCEIRNLKYN
jgi:hypothetical protein